MGRTPRVGRMCTWYRKYHYILAHIRPLNHPRAKYLFRFAVCSAQQMLYIKFSHQNSTRAIALSLGFNIGTRGPNMGSLISSPTRILNIRTHTLSFPTLIDPSPPDLSNFRTTLIFTTMKWSNESFPLFHARKLKSGSKLNLDCHQAELLQPCPTYGRGDRPGTPRPHRYEYTHPDAHQPPIVPSRYERSSRSYAPRPTPYGERPARHTRRSKDEGNLLSIGGYSDPDYRKGGSKKVLERATSGLSKLRDSFNPLRSKVRPRHQLKESGPYEATVSTERAADAMVVDDYYGSPTPYQRNLSNNHNVSLVHSCYHLFHANTM